MADEREQGRAEEAEPTPAPVTPEEGAAPRRKGKPVTQRLGQFVVVGVAVLFGIFAVFNSQPVDFNWVFGGTEVVEQGGQRVSGGVPLIVLLIAAFALGVLLGRATTWRRTRELKRATKA